MKLPDFFSKKKFISMLALFLLVFLLFFKKQAINDVSVFIDDPLVPLSDTIETDLPSDLNEHDNNVEEIIIDVTDNINYSSEETNSSEEAPFDENSDILDTDKEHDSTEKSEEIESLNNTEASESEESPSETVIDTKIAFFYLNIRNFDFEEITSKKCYYVGKGSVLEERLDGVVQNVTVNESPAYNGEIGRYDYDWSYIDDSEGKYCVYGTVTPAENIQTEITALYYLNINNLDIDTIDYKKCYYVGKGSVVEDEDYKGRISVSTSIVPDYNGEKGRFDISWDKITYIEATKSYKVFGSVTASSNIQTEKTAYYYLNTRNLDLDDISYQKCYYVGKGSVIEDEDYKGNKSVSTSIIPDYNGEAGNYIISWDKIADISGNYRVFGVVTKKETSFDNIALLKKATAVTAGDIVTTKGFYVAGDGGAAQYTISDSTSYSNGDNRGIQLDNGLFALLNISDNTVCANQLGAYGDGQHDDVAVVQRIVDLGYNVSLCNGQTYKFISNGLFISNNISITGNGATILIDDSYSPQKGDSQYYLIRNIYGNKLSFFNLNNINIKVNFSNNRIIGREFNVISPLLIKNVSLDNVTVETNNSNNCINCVWINNGCDSISITNCNFINDTTGATGGALWITAKKDTIFSDFHNIKSCVISNTHMYCSSADEVFGLWGTGNINAELSNTTIEGNIKATGRTRVVSIFSKGDNHASVNVNMNNCVINSNCNTSSSASYYDSVFGIGTDYSSNEINVNMNNCDVSGTVYGSLIFPSCFRPDYVTRFDANSRPVTINFIACNIACSSTITGTATNYYNTGAEYPTYAWDCNFKNCKISCGTAFAYLYVPGNLRYYIPKIEIENCDIQVDSAKAFICQSELSAGVDLEISNTDITARGVNDIVESKSTRQRSVTTQNNAQDQTILSDVSINGKDISD